MVSMKVSLIDSPTTPAIATNASPIIRAPAVDDVRRGLRAAFSRANWPGIPNRRWMGQPIVRAARLANAGDKTVVPMNTRIAPRAMNVTSGMVSNPPNSPSPRDTVPIATMRPPMRIRRPRLLLVRRGAALRAAMGEIRRARRAGDMDETMVTPNPTTIAKMIVRTRNSIGPSGSANPPWRSRNRSRRASPIPAMRPTTVLITPTIAASPMTERDTWRPVAPMARSSPSSRTRCPSTI